MLSLRRAQVQSLVGELRPHKLCSMVKKIKNIETVREGKEMVRKSFHFLKYSIMAYIYLL